MAHDKRHRTLEGETVNLGFQIAPMIDVVFVIMLFFMVMAGAVKVERELKTQLPGLGTPAVTNEEVPPDEIMVTVEESNVVTLNEEEFDSPTDKALPNFTGTLMRLKQEADHRGAKVMVTIQAEEQARYERVIDVLNSMAKAQISNVTFTIGGDDF
ncbi:MAG TPA: biopolymer transporter ExbD [Verrucomicrobiales bacterium]|nr:biopolymer transporter ExbD [Verrucomicrobiales bacterium]HCN77389.1 biopolymer transporter ExbD [Verrucomicrobiales bacterium]HRJ08611.1 biopolymer transporter ExbD [Prosthecobacter sp.]HRK14243.1 biopolymer transporter ExbD [Prosthecobacter sp.]